MILNLALNISTDVMILCIPLPIFSDTELSWQRKLRLMMPFSMGIFTIPAAIVCKAEALYLDGDSWWGLWCMREASVGVIVANMPYCLGLLRRVKERVTSRRRREQASFLDAQTSKRDSVLFTT